MLESSAMAYQNILYIAANILFDLETGKTTQVFMLAPRESDASVFTLQDANSYLEFVKRRAQHLEWSVQASNERPGAYVIRGVQYV